MPSQGKFSCENCFTKFFLLQEQDIKGHIGSKNSKRRPCYALFRDSRLNDSMKNGSEKHLHGKYLTQMSNM